MCVRSAPRCERSGEHSGLPTSRHVSVRPWFRALCMGHNGARGEKEVMVTDVQNPRPKQSACENLGFRTVTPTEAFTIGNSYTPNYQTVFL